MDRWMLPHDEKSFVSCLGRFLVVAAAAAAAAAAPCLRRPTFLLPFLRPPAPPSRQGCHHAARMSRGIATFCLLCKRWLCVLAPSLARQRTLPPIAALLLGPGFIPLPLLASVAGLATFLGSSGTAPASPERTQIRRST
ncbi:hypothetical protein BC567DRAFT_236117 [Phyllosticta citribraziliensis]